MRTYFSVLLTNSSVYLNSFKNTVSLTLESLDKRVALLATAIFLGVCTLYYCFSSHYFRATKENVEPKEVNQQPKGEPVKPKGEPVKPEEKPVEPEELKPRFSLETAKKPKDVPASLEKNRLAAQKQQNEEKGKGFKIQEAQPTVIAKAKTVWGDTIEIGEREIKGEEKEIDGKKEKVGIASCQGARPTMEDTDIADYQSLKVVNQKHLFALFGVFDGHAGSGASVFVKQNIAQYLKEALESYNQNGLTDEGIFTAFKECFKALDEDYPARNDGTTATVAVILDGKIWVANAGDSRTILVKNNGETIQASEDAKPGIDRYKRKIEKLGGKVIFDRVNGMLATAQAIGDKMLQGRFDDEKKCHLCPASPNPKITCYPLEDFKDGYIVLACDGLYDVATTNEVGQSIQEMAGKNMSVEQMSRSLVFNAITCGSGDNVSAMVVKI